MKTRDIEYYIARQFDWRQNIIVPNVSWGLCIHECDLLIISKCGYCTEVEIKISKGDLKKDASKIHGHGIHGKRIKHLYFAIPESMAGLDCINMIPAHAGIFVVSDGGFTQKIRSPKSNKNAEPLSDTEIKKVLHLGCMRIWSLKYTVKTLLEMVKEN
jgi:hypothetical protein